MTSEKGGGTQLKDIPNVAFKLSKRKPDDNLHILHAILFGKKVKAYSLKRNIGQFSGFMWGENVKKQKAKVREKLDKCVKEKLMDFCDVLNIPIKRVVKKEELSAKLLEFLEYPHATTDILLADKEQMAKVSCKSYFNIVACSHKRKKNGTLPVLPDEVIFNILLWLPAEVLFNLMIYVCRKWRKIISDPVFVHEHLFRLTTGLLIQDCSCLLSAHIVEFKKWYVNVKELSFQPPQKVLSSFDGLVVFRDGEDWRVLHVANPVTKQRVALPPFSLLQMPYFDCGLACVRSMGVYKVVCSYVDRNQYLKCMIITVSTDNAWRSIDIQHLSDTAQGFMFVLYSIGSFIYWASRLFSYVLCLDVEAETVSHFSVPEDCKDDSNLLAYKVAGCSLSLLAKPKYELRWNILLLTDSQKGVWTKLYEIDLEGQGYTLDTRCSIGL